MKSPDPLLKRTIYIKQHGCQRTGTNTMRLALERNFHVPVLVNVLGWKHGPPTNWKSWMEKHAKNGEFVKAVRTPPRLINTHHRSEDLHRAMNEDRIKVLICIKEPYQFAASAYHHSGVRFGMGNTGMLQYYNDMYREWLEAFPEAFIMQCEWLDSKKMYQAAMGRLAQWYGLESNTPYERIDRVAMPSDDNSRNLRHTEYKPAKKPIPDSIRDEVTHVIDWKLFSQFGYEPCQP